MYHHVFRIHHGIHHYGITPGDYADRYAFKKYGSGGATITESDMSNIRNKFGLDRPAYERYLTWIGNIVTKGDFGQSFAFETSVNNVIGQRLWLTLGLLFMTLMLTYAIAIPIGIYAAVRRQSIADYSLSVFSYLGLALPNFMLALVMLYLGVRFFDTSVGGLFSPEMENAPWGWDKLADLFKHLLVPAIVLAWSATAFQLQTMRATMLDELNKLSVTRSPRTWYTRVEIVIEISGASGDQPDRFDHRFRRQPNFF